jgi:hypothetical protein
MAASIVNMSIQLIRIVDSLVNDSKHKIQQERPNGKEVVAVRKLPSRDLHLFLTSERTKAALLQEKSWTACFGQSCSIAENIHKVLVHSVRVDSIDPGRAENIAKLQEETKHSIMVSKSRDSPGSTGNTPQANHMPL